MTARPAGFFYPHYFGQAGYHLTRVCQRELQKTSKTLVQLPICFSVGFLAFFQLLLFRLRCFLLRLALPRSRFLLQFLLLLGVLCGFALILRHAHLLRWRAYRARPAQRQQQYKSANPSSSHLFYPAQNLVYTHRAVTSSGSVPGRNTSPGSAARFSRWISLTRSIRNWLVWLTGVVFLAVHIRVIFQRFQMSDYFGWNSQLLRQPLFQNRCQPMRFSHWR